MNDTDHTRDGDRRATLSEQKRLLRRATFNRVASRYGISRPLYPDTLVQDILVFCGSELRVLEIGCGTGQLTLPLADKVASILAVELGPDLAEQAHRKLFGKRGVTIVNADFDSWSAPPHAFDLVVAATAFHWLDPATRLSRCVRALRTGGTLAIVETYWNAGSGRDSFFVDSQQCYARWDPEYQPGFEPTTLGSLPSRNEQLELSGYFGEIRLQQYLWEKEYTSDEYCSLLGTTSTILTFAAETADNFLRCMANLIDSKYSGRIGRQHVYRTWLARLR